MVNIIVYDIARKAYTYEEGIEVYTLISRAFSQEEQVALSFERIDSIPSSFANGCFVKLFESFGLNRIKKDLKIEKSTKQINKMIKDRLVFEENRVR